MLHQLTLAIIAASTLAAQSQLSGKFVFAEEETLGVIEFDGKGNVSGAQYRQQTGVVPFTGAYNTAAGGSGAISLYVQTADEEGVSAPTALATYQFLQSDAKGFMAIQTTAGVVSVAKFSPANASKSVSGGYSFESEGKSASGEERAELGLLQFFADGNLTGKQIVKQSGVTELIAMTGSYVAEANGFWTIRLLTPGGTDEDGQASPVTTTLTGVASSNGTFYALRRGSSQLGVITFEPVR